ncbi:MAG: ABC transporter permease [Dehalococcoidia bacterium]|nr:ABC transporter permease [Dehalococcoidia bacterium]
MQEAAPTLPFANDPWVVQAAQRVLTFARRNPTMALGLLVVGTMVIISIAAPLIERHAPDFVNPIDRLQSPNRSYWFGTDQVGRDIYARVVHGGRISLIVGFSVAGLTMAFGAAIGLISGYFRRADTFIMAAMDGLMAIPMILLAIALVAILGASTRNVIIALCVVHLPREVRLVRASVLSLREQQYVEAARAIGASPWRILGRHVFPGTLPVLIIQGSFTCSTAILSEATLSFLGAGASPEVASWGRMMAESTTYFQRAPWAIMFPGIALGLTVLSVSLIGDGLRDVLDPKLSRRT